MIFKPQFLKPKFKGGNDLIESVINNSMVEINKNVEYNFQDISSNSKVIFYVDTPFIENFKNEFSNLHNITVKPKSLSFDFLKDDVLQNLYYSDYLVFLAYNTDDYNIIDYLYTKAKKDCQSKLIVFLHNSPLFLKPYVLHNITILGCFTNHPLAYTADINVLKHKIIPADKKKLPVSLGLNNNLFYDMQKEEFTMKPAEGFSPIPFFTTEWERKLYNENFKLKTTLLLIAFLLFINSLYKIIKYRNKKEENYTENTRFEINTNKQLTVKDGIIFSTILYIFVVGLIVIYSLKLGIGSNWFQKLSPSVEWILGMTALYWTTLKAIIGREKIEKFFKNLFSNNSRSQGPTNTLNK